MQLYAQPRLVNHQVITESCSFLRRETNLQSLDTFFFRNAHHVKLFCDQDNLSSSKAQGYISKSSRIGIVSGKKTVSH